VLILVAFSSREWLFGDGTCSPAKCEQESLGWVSREFVPWLGSAWWHFAVVVALAVAVVTLASVLLARRRLRRRKGAIGDDAVPSEVATKSTSLPADSCDTPRKRPTASTPTSASGDTERTSPR
jgi:hypothetical protein